MLAATARLGARQVRVTMPGVRAGVFLLRVPQPVLIDCGMRGQAGNIRRALRGVGVAPQDLALIALGARRLIRIGTCGALNGELGMGDLVRVRTALARDGTSKALGARGQVDPDRDLTNRIEAPAVTAVSVDVFYGHPDTTGADVVEMESATIFQVARLRGVHAAAVLGVTDLLHEGQRERTEQDELEELGRRLGESAYTALAAGG